MTRRVASCPSCGAEISFRWSGAVQTTCSHCRSILVRHDVDLDKVGEQSDPPPITSRIQIGTSGRYGRDRFTVVGRIAYRWGRGSWSEWHVVFDDGRSGWISDAQAEYVVSFLAASAKKLPSLKTLKPGAPFRHEGVEYAVSNVTTATYAGVEGELPFEYWDHDEVPYVDLVSDTGRFATIDFSEKPPLLFLGEAVELESLWLEGLREETQATVRGVQTLNCPSCAGSVTIRHAELAVTVVCEYCGSVLDSGSEELRVVQKAGPKKKEYEPEIPLGSRGRLHGKDYEVLGFQVRTIRVGGTAYSWREYLLHNPTRGYRYLSEFDGHWNDIVPLRVAPKLLPSRRPVAKLYGESFRHFQNASAETVYVLGEFPWEVRRGDRVTVDDYVAPPRMLSCETTRDERTWSLGEYTLPSKIHQAFGLERPLRRPKGVFANQPSPHGGLRQSVVSFGVLAVLWMGLFVARTVLPHSQVVLSEWHEYRPALGDTAAPVVLGPFTLEGRTSNLEVELEAGVDNSWVYFTVSLLNVATGETVDFGREVGYYHGVDGGERWSEGSTRERPRIGSVAPGEYLLRVVPEGPTNTPYRVRLRRDVPQISHFLFAFLVLAVPVTWVGLRHTAFETRRWQESDYAPE